LYGVPSVNVYQTRLLPYPHLVPVSSVEFPCFANSVEVCSGRLSGEHSVVRLFLALTS